MPEEPVLDDQARMSAIASAALTHGEHGADEKSGRIVAASSAGGKVSHHGWLLVIRALCPGQCPRQDLNLPG